MSSAETSENVSSLFAILQGTVVEVLKNDGKRYQGLLSKDSILNEISLRSPFLLLSQACMGK